MGSLFLALLLALADNFTENMTPLQLFSCECYEIFENNYSTGQLSTAAFVYYISGCASKFFKFSFERPLNHLDFPPQFAC